MRPVYRSDDDRPANRHSMPSNFNVASSSDRESDNFNLMSPDFSSMDSKQKSNALLVIFLTVFFKKPNFNGEDPSLGS